VSGALRQLGEHRLFSVVVSRGRPPASGKCDVTFTAAHQTKLSTSTINSIQTAKTKTWMYTKFIEPANGGARQNS
jgi:hypothetical protein